MPDIRSLMNVADAFTHNALHIWRPADVHDNWAGAIYLIESLRLAIEGGLSMPRQHMTLESVFEFGSHEGEQLEDVIEDYPSYIEYLISDDVVTFDEEAMEKITKKGIA